MLSVLGQKIKYWLGLSIQNFTNNLWFLTFDEPVELWQVMND